MLVRPCSVYRCERRCSQSGQHSTIRRLSFRCEILQLAYIARFYHNRPGALLQNVQGHDITLPSAAKRTHHISLSPALLSSQNRGTQTPYLAGCASFLMGQILLRRGFIASFLYNSAIQNRPYYSDATAISTSHQKSHSDQDVPRGQTVTPEDSTFRANAQIAPPLPPENTITHTTWRSIYMQSPGADSGRKSYNDDRQRKDSAIREAINKAIDAAAAESHRFLKPSQRRREYFLRSRCLYTKTLIHPHWNNNFHSLYQHKLKGENMSTLWEKLKLDYEEEAMRWLTGINWVTEDLHYLERQWFKLTRDERARLWPPIALWLLINSPRAALSFLVVTSRPPYAAFNMIAMCFLYLRAFHFDKDFAPDERYNQLYHKALRICLNPSKWPVIQAFEPGIRVYLSQVPPEDMAAAFDTVVNQKIYLEYQTLTFFMDLFVKQGDISRSLAALKLVRTCHCYPQILSNPHVLDRCCMLLSLDYVIEKDNQRYFRILPEILDFGVPLNQPMLNIIFRNALKQKAPEFVPHVLHEMGEKGLSPNSYTYISLLDDAVSRRDLQHLDVIVREISGQESLRTNPFVTSKMLHIFYSLDRLNPDGGWGDTDMFSRMLNIYSRAHNIQPLVDLGIIHEGQDGLHIDESEESPPSNHALCIMTAAYLRILGSTREVRNVFDRFLELRDQGHEAIGPLAESDYIYNTFLYEFAHRRAHRMENCVAVLSTMLQPLPPSAVLQSQNNRPLEQVKPTIHTWTIFLSAFVRERQPQAIEKIRDMMAKQGMKFNDYTWNTAVRGFSKMQMVEQAAQAVNTMVKEGWTVDEYTLKGMRYVRDYDRLFALLDNVEAKINGDARGKSVERE
ncbi:hypothetical protein PABG_06662 [Paracoccidioides brasiliensis Pb03]|nr:hypothetical protein PABG_06662 [Paracoccidioides brasiliensis Pb03]